MSNFLSKISSIIPCNIQIIKVDFIRFMSYYGIVKKRISEILRYFPTFLQNSTSFFYNPNICAKLRGNAICAHCKTYLKSISATRSDWNSASPCSNHRLHAPSLWRCAESSDAASTHYTPWRARAAKPLFS